MQTPAIDDPSLCAPAAQARHESPLPCPRPLDPETAARSARNIAVWRAYLPAACVQTMIRMGWDRTT